MSSLRVHLFKNGRSDFLELLTEKQVEFDYLPLAPDAIRNAGEVIEIINAVKALSPFGALAFVLVTWLHGRASRKVIVQAKENTVIYLEGYSVDEVSRILESASSVTVIQTTQDEK